MAWQRGAEEMSREWLCELQCFYDVMTGGARCSFPHCDGVFLCCFLLLVLLAMCAWDAGVQGVPMIHESCFADRRSVGCVSDHVWVVVLLGVLSRIARIITIVICSDDI